ncbi:GPW/gp25 family protein [Vannielia litorea]|uniref:GPW/gp25 family protein n=1 Tax=Vannielia litorea TaxID=1217970 RepID=UPI001BCF2FB2|nr:GPW/gp25 family protein [Vannielia litorea]MBS8226342.1 hypothetical protein [Vannielia litorea]
MPPVSRPASSFPAFIGRGWSFPPRFDIAPDDAGGLGMVEMVDGTRDIDQSLEVLMFTLMGERVMRPTYGVGLQLDVFMPMDLSEMTLLQRRIEKALLFFEPRITDTVVTVAPAPDADARLDVAIDYRIVGTNTRGNRVFPFYHDEATHAPG